MRGERTRRDAPFLHVGVSMSDKIADFVEVRQEQNGRPVPAGGGPNGPSPLPFFSKRSNPDGPIFMEGRSTDFREVVSAPVPARGGPDPPPVPLCCG